MGATSQMAMSVTLFCMMFAVALGLKVADFGYIRRTPRLFLAGFLAQVLALPLFTLGLCIVLQPDPSIALGMLLIACCPGGNVSNILVLLARGNTALSVSLTATSSVLAAFVTPVAIIFWTSLYSPTEKMLNDIDLDTAEFLLQTLLVLALPLFIGMLLARFTPKLAAMIRPTLVLVSSLGLVAIILVALVHSGEFIVSVGSLLIAYVVLHNAGAYCIGYVVAHLIGADTADRRAISIEVGIQNAGLGIVIIMAQLGGVGATAAIAGLWGTWHIVAGLALVAMFRAADARAIR